MRILFNEHVCVLLPFFRFILHPTCCGIITYRRYYNVISVLLSPIFSENDGINFLRKRPNGVGFVIRE